MSKQLEREIGGQKRVSKVTKYKSVRASENFDCVLASGR